MVRFKARGKWIEKRHEKRKNGKRKLKSYFFFLPDNMINRKGIRGKVGTHSGM